MVQKDDNGSGVSVGPFTDTYAVGQTISVTKPDSTASSIGNSLAAITAINGAVSKLGQVQGRVGAGENQLQYAIALAQSQITNFSSAASQIRDADVAAEAANLTKAQVLQQASMAAMAQANSAPQQVLALLRG
jgi:flagellin